MKRYMTKKDISLLEMDIVNKICDIADKQKINWPGKYIDYLKENDPEFCEMVLKRPYYPFMKEYMETRRDANRLKRNKNKRGTV